MKLSDNYYSGRDVQRLLGITEPRLRTLVSNQQLTKVYPPGRKAAMYLKSEVNSFAEKWEAFLLAKEPPTTSFSIANIDDMLSEYELAKRVLGATMSIEQRQAWLLKNPESDYVVKHGDKVVAYLTLLPLKPKALQAFMSGEIRGWQITPDDIETFEPNKDIECVIMGTASDPDKGEIVRTGYVLILVRGIIAELENLGKRGVRITKIYSTSETSAGIAMAIRLGMEEIKPRIGKRIRFTLDVEESDSFILTKYKEALAEWEKQQESNNHINHMSLSENKN